MKDIRPCPYCSSEVEVVKLNPKKGEKKPVYRIQCTRCGATVARGLGFSCETTAEMQERIKQYEKILEREFSKVSSSSWKQSDKAKERDRKAKLSYNPYD